MKPGYYFSESGRLQLWYPPVKGKQVFEVYWDTPTEDPTFGWKRYTLDLQHVFMLEKAFDFEFLGDL